MVAIERAKSESRVRDLKRHRLVLTIGNYHFHLTKDEARVFSKQLAKLLK